MYDFNFGCACIYNVIFAFDPTKCVNYVVFSYLKFSPILKFNMHGVYLPCCCFVTLRYSRGLVGYIEGSLKASKNFS